MRYCLNCGSELKDGEKFCRKCGTAASAPAKILPPSAGAASWICPACGTVIGNQFAFCTECGKARPAAVTEEPEKTEDPKIAEVSEPVMIPAQVKKYDDLKTVLEWNAPEEPAPAKETVMKPVLTQADIPWQKEETADEPEDKPVMETGSVPAADPVAETELMPEGKPVMETGSVPAAEPQAESEKSAQPESAVTVPEKASWTCPACGEKMSASYNFCFECGAKKPEPTEKECPKCRKIVPRTHKFCFNCGYRF